MDTKPVNAKNIAVKLLYLSVAVAGLVAAFVTLFAGSNDIVGKGFETFALVLIIDAFILVGLVAKHTWLRNTTWIVAILNTIPAMILVWTDRYTEYYTDRYTDYYDDYYYRFGSINSTENSVNVWAEKISTAGYIILTGLAIACIISLFYKNAKEEKISLYSYWGTIGFGLLSAIMAAIVYVFDNVEFASRLSAASIVLASTFGLIMLISIVVRSMKTPKLPPGVTPYHPGNFSTRPTDPFAPPAPQVPYQQPNYPQQPPVPERPEQQNIVETNPEETLF